MASVSPIGEQGGHCPAALVLADPASPDADQPVPAPGLEAGTSPRKKVASGWEDMVVAGGESDVARPHRQRRRRLGDGPGHHFATGFVPQGIGADLIATLEGFSRDDVDRYALTSQQRRGGAGRRAFDRSVIAVTTERPTMLRARRISNPTPRWSPGAV